MPRTTTTGLLLLRRRTTRTMTGRGWPLLVVTAVLSTLLIVSVRLKEPGTAAACRLSPPWHQNREEAKPVTVS